MTESDPQELLAIAKAIEVKVKEAVPDMDPLKVRSALFLVAESYLQAAALDKVTNDVYRHPPSK